ncbi:MAG: NAD-dependent epimerase/dehydratase family protein [Oscillospiraceae bacterium]|nr:NAD-dependent epimerase/dehydratase family protein [Oscillospiraceae bacterium]
MPEHNRQAVYIVTGAAGHLGGAVTKKLNELGKIVYALCLPNEKHLPQGGHIRVFYGDVCNTDSLTDMFEHCANEKEVTVIHCAGIVSIASKFDQKVYDVNVTGTKNIISLCGRYNIQKLVYISSVHAIPELPASEKITEIGRFSPDDVVGLYAKTKAEATQCVLDYAKCGHDANVIHPSGIVGPGDFGRGHITQLVIDYYKGTLTSGIDGGYDFVDVRDVADGILSCCENGRSGECYILSGRYFKVYELLNLLHEITGKRKIKRILPLWFVKLTAPLSEIYYKILRQPPLFTAYSIYTLNTNANFSHEKAAKELGYGVRPMEQTLADTIKWLAENNRL